MQILQRIPIKQIITEKSKKTLQMKFEKEIIQLERECQQLLFEQRKLQKKVIDKQKVFERFQQEIERRKDDINLVEYKLEQLELLDIGSEIVEKEVEGFIHVEVGMNWKNIQQCTAIIIKDDIVVRIEEE